MKSYRAFIIALAVLPFTYSAAQDVCVRAKEVVDRLNGTHLYPLDVGDSLSSRLFDEFFHTLDPEGEILSLANISELGRFRFHLDEELMSGKCEFVQAANSMIAAKLQRIRTFTDSILQKPVQFKTAQFAPSLGTAEHSFCATDIDLKMKLTRGYQMAILGNMHEGKWSAGIAADEAGSLEPAGRALVRQSTIKALDRRLADKAALAKFTESCFLKTLPRIFDPHSEFFSEEEMRAFEESINPEAMSFGIEFEDTRLGEVKVERLAPGGPAWNSNQVREGDILISIQLGSGEEYDAREMDAVTVTDLLTLPDEPAANLSFRTADGITRKVSLQKSRIENKENLVSGLVLKGKHTFGYISLPSFYTASENESGTGCANDVAKEILKLKSEKIEGLILDLRFNGGGSTKEAVDLAGIFIDVGPLAVIEMKGDQVFTLKDMNRGLAYDGPLIIMVSKASASASELVAAALQDHKRAVIVGSKSYGKATGQIIVPISDDATKASFLKVTHERLFRITGASLQQSGLQVDYELPNLIQALLPGEITLRYSLLPINTNKKTYYQPYTAWKPAMTPALTNASKERINSSAGFTAVTELKIKLREPIPLDPKQFFNFFDKVEELSAGISRGTSAIDYHAFNSKANEQVFAVDKYHQELNKKHKGEIESSIYVQEVCHILEDLLKQP